MKIFLLLSLLIFSQTQDSRYRTLYVLDGDTIQVVSEKNDTLRVRLLGIDAPENSTPFSRQAKALTDSLTRLGKIRLRITGTDIYQRTIADVFVVTKDQEFHINLWLVERGLAWHYKRYDNRVEFAEAENRARLARKGIWSMNNPTPPWEYRKQKRK